MEIGRLTAVFDADTRKLDSDLKAMQSRIESLKRVIASVKTDDIGFKPQRLAALKDELSQATAHYKNLQRAQRETAQSAKAMASDLESALGTLTPRLASLVSLAGPASVATAAFIAELAAVTALTVGLYELARSTAEVQGHLYDLSQQTGVSVETLSALGELAKTTGGNLDSIAQSLVVFQGNLEDASDWNSKSAKTFRDLNVSVSDTEQSLRDTLTAIAGLPEGFQQTNVAAELFGRRGGKQMLAILKESKGDINSVIRELQSMGLANSEAARRADEFNDQLVKLDTQLTGIKVAIGNEIVPTITIGLKQVERIIKENKDGFEALGVVAKGLTILIGAPLLGAIGTLGFVWKAHQPVINLIRDAYEATAAAMQLITGRIPQIDANAIPSQLGLGEGQSGIDLLNKAGESWRKSRDQFLKPFNLDEIFPKAKQAAADPGVALMRQLQGELRRLSTETKVQEVAAQLLDEQYSKMNPKLREQIKLLAKIIDVTRSKAEADAELKRLEDDLRQSIHAENEELGRFLQGQAEALRELKFGQKSALDEANDFIDTFKNLSGAMDANQKFWLRFNAMLIRVQQTVRSLKTDLENIAEGTPPIAPNGIPDLGGNVLTAADLADLGVPPPDFSEIRRQMRELGFELTDIFSDSINEGFHNGISSGLEELSLGLLRIVEDVFLRRMAEGLADLLSGIGTGGSGGGWWKKLLGIGTSALTGGFGGGGGAATGGLGSAFAGAFASGGTIPMGQWGIVHDNEKVFASAAGAQVIPAMGGKGGSQVINNHYHINFPPERVANSYNSKRSRRQLAQDLLAVIQGSQA